MSDFTVTKAQWRVLHNLSQGFPPLHVDPRTVESLHQQGLIERDGMAWKMTALGQYFLHEADR